jgi:nitroreductase
VDVMTAIKARRSIRSYEPKPIEEEKLNRILEAGRLAPSARNMQEWRFVVVRDPETKKELVPAAKNQAFVGEAAVVIAACAVETQHIMTCGQLCYPIDVAIAVDHMTLKAWEEGIGSCWIGAFYENKVKDVLEIPQSVRIVSLLALGYPKEPPPARPRKPLQDIVCYDTWS